MSGSIHEIPIIITSSLSAGAINKSADGSSFEIHLEDPISIPQEISSCTLEVQEVSIWWVTPNISVSLGNNKLFIEHLSVNYIITIPDGLYSLEDLNSAIDRETQIVTGFEDLISLQSDNSTQKVNIVINQAGTRLDFTQVDTFRDILGFNSQLVPVAVTTGVFNKLADNVASFNTIDFFLLHSDLIIKGIRTNNTYNHTIAQIPIDVEPGSQIISRPFNPPKIGAWELRGAVRNHIRFWLTDQDNNLVNTFNEDFSARIVIKYIE